MPDLSLRRLILVPALLTLAVTLVRLTGELLRWSPALFNRAAGGDGALIGIVWLIPVFGVLFGLRLAQDGRAPASVGKTLGWAAVALGVNTALAMGAFALAPSPVAQLAIFAVGSWLAILLARGGGDGLGRVLLAYGLAVRIPVVVIMFLSIFGGWDTHYTKPRPDFLPMGPWGLFCWTASCPRCRSGST